MPSWARFASAGADPSTSDQLTRPERVHTGASLLTEIWPEWPFKVDLRTLRPNHGILDNIFGWSRNHHFECEVLDRVYDLLGVGHDLTGRSTSWLAARGFDVLFEEEGNKALDHELMEEWRRQVRASRLEFRKDHNPPPRGKNLVPPIPVRNHDLTGKTLCWIYLGSKSKYYVDSSGQCGRIFTTANTTMPRT